jgi:hypothetical protein
MDNVIYIYIYIYWKKYLFSRAVDFENSGEDPVSVFRKGRIECSLFF